MNGVSTGPATSGSLKNSAARLAQALGKIDTLFSEIQGRLFGPVPSGAPLAKAEPDCFQSQLQSLAERAESVASFGDDVLKRIASE